MGRRLERAISLCAITDVLANVNGQWVDQPDPLGVLLDLTDSQITYRSRYLTGPRREPVLDLLLLDPENPRSLAFQLQTLVSHVEALPNLSEDLMPEPPLRAARALHAPFTSLTVAELDPARLAQTRQGLFDLSGAIAERYFLQYEKEEAPRGSLLG